MRRSRKRALLGSRQAHLPHDGLITRFGVQEVKICTVLYMHQPGFAFLVGLLEVVKRLVSSFQAGINVDEFER
jgi:hypothetical protein